MRALMILTGALIGGAVGVFGAVFLLGALRMHGGGGPVWEATLITALAGLSALVFAILSGWLTSSVDTDQLAVAPTRHLLTLSMTLVGGALGLAAYLGLVALAGGPGTLAPGASKVFGGALMLLGGSAGLGAGRLLAVKAYY